MKLNGKITDIKGNKNLGDLLKENGFNTERIVVELNGTIISRNNYDKTEITNNDVIEVLSFVGGG